MRGRLGDLLTNALAVHLFATRGIQHFGAHPVGSHVLQPRSRIPTPLTGILPFTHPVLSEAEGMLAEPRRHPQHPEIERLGHMRIGRNPILRRHHHCFGHSISPF
jgi:hypothetical protein